MAMSPPHPQLSSSALAHPSGEAMDPGDCTQLADPPSWVGSGPVWTSWPVVVSAYAGLLVSVPQSRPQSYPQSLFPAMTTPLWKTLLSLSPPRLNRTCLGHGTDTLLGAPDPAVPSPQDTTAPS